MYTVKALVGTEGDAAIDSALTNMGFDSRITSPSPQFVRMQARIRLMVRVRRLFPNLSLKQARNMADNMYAFEVQ